MSSKCWKKPSRHAGFLPTEQGGDRERARPDGHDHPGCEGGLGANGLEAVYQDDEADTVTAQVAAPNEIVQKGSEVLLYTANTGEIITEAEIEQVTVPNVLGRTGWG